MSMKDIKPKQSPAIEVPVVDDEPRVHSVLKRFLEARNFAYAMRS